MNTIITPTEARKLGRPIGKVSDDKILAFILEVENTIIRRSIGDELYLELTEKTEFDEPYVTLLNGGKYADRCGNVHIFNGLKVAEAYYVYAQNVRAGDFESTRYGMVIKDDSYSNGLSSKERDQVANNATEVADIYLAECLEYCRRNNIRTGNRQSSHLTAGCVIRKIG